MVHLLKFLIVLFSTFIFFITYSKSIDTREPYSEKELILIDEFRPMVSKFLTMDYHKTDAYLLRWIRSSNFDLKSAAKDLEKHYNWRVKNKIDSIPDTEETGITPNPHKYLPYNIDGHDKGRRPIAHIPAGRWNLRKYVIAGKPEIAQRHYQEILEKLARKLFRESATLGKDIDQFYVLADINGYSLREIGCFGCVPIAANYGRTALAYFPFFKNYTLVNVPRIALPVLNVIKSVLRDRVSIDSYDFDKAAWRKKLLKEIDLDQLPLTMQ